MNASHVFRLRGEILSPVGHFFCILRHCLSVHTPLHSLARSQHGFWKNSSNVEQPFGASLEWPQGSPGVHLTRVHAKKRPRLHKHFGYVCLYKHTKFVTFAEYKLSCLNPVKWYDMMKVMPGGKAFVVCSVSLSQFNQEEEKKEKGGMEPPPLQRCRSNFFSGGQI